MYRYWWFRGLIPQPGYERLRGAHRNGKGPKEVASDRMDVSGDVLDKHYDKAPAAERRQRRKELLDDM